MDTWDEARFERVLTWTDLSIREKESEEQRDSNGTFASRKFQEKMRKKHPEIESDSFSARELSKAYARRLEVHKKIAQEATEKAVKAALDEKSSDEEPLVDGQDLDRIAQLLLARIQELNQVKVRRRRRDVVLFAALGCTLVILGLTYCVFWALKNAPPDVEIDIDPGALIGGSLGGFGLLLGGVTYALRGTREG